MLDVNFRQVQRQVGVGGRRVCCLKQPVHRHSCVSPGEGLLWKWSLKLCKSFSEGVFATQARHDDLEQARWLSVSHTANDCIHLPSTPTPVNQQEILEFKGGGWRGGGGRGRMDEIFAYVVMYPPYRWSYSDFG